MKKILFGAGKVGKHLLSEDIIKDVAYFCDTRPSDTEIFGIKVISFKQLIKIHNDYQVVLTVKNKNAKEEIKAMLESNEISYIEYDELDEVKYAGEQGYWDYCFEKGQGHFDNSHYKKLMLGIAGESSDAFLAGKVVADFGCGPRGSLAWMESPAMKIGIDVLAKNYVEKYGQEMISHGMTYVTSTEKYIPLPDNTVDCLITINSLDHVRNIQDIANELLRILKKDGLILCSFNLNEPKTECEPQTLTEQLLEEVLLKHFNIISYRIAKKNYEDTYKDMFEEKYVSKSEGDDAYILWVCGRKNRDLS